jgi:hypothetical protein
VDILVAADVTKLDEVIEKLDKLRATVEGSLSIRAVGGVVIANELIALKPKLVALKASIEADVAAV